MEIVRFVIGAILPYVAVAAFVVGMAYRFRSWATLASPAMTLFPAPSDEQGNTLNTLEEAFLFKSAFRADQVLWAMAWVFHAVLLLVLVGHLRVFTNVDGLLMKLGMSDASIQALSSGAGGAAGVVILLAALLLLARRLALPRVREITGAADYVILLLIAAIILTGDLMRFGAEHFDLATTRQYFGTLAVFGDATTAGVLRNNLFLLHMGLALILLMCMPFSKLLHFGGIFFTQQLIHKR
jgi:nitrate reductase gamma subunit